MPTTTITFLDAAGRDVEAATFRVMPPCAAVAVSVKPPVLRTKPST